MIFKRNKRYEETLNETALINGALENGMKLIYDYIPKSEITQVGCLINAGSMDEYSLNVLSGTAHFIEHMVFNGSTRYAKEEINSIRESGGFINAYTSSDILNIYPYIPYWEV